MRLNPGPSTKFANLLDFALRWLVHSCNMIFSCTFLVTFFFPLQPPHPPNPDKHPGRPTPESLISGPIRVRFASVSGPFRGVGQKGRKGAGAKGAGVANCRIFRSAVPSVVVWSILLVFPVWGEEKVMTIYDAGPLAAGPLCGLLSWVGSEWGRGEGLQK